MTQNFKIFNKNSTTKYFAYGKHSTLSNLCDSGVPNLYHEFQSIPSVLSIPRVIVHTMSQEISITEIQTKVTSTQITDKKATEIQFLVVQKYKLQEYRNTNYINTKI